MLVIQSVKNFATTGCTFSYNYFNSFMLMYISFDYTLELPLHNTSVLFYTRQTENKCWDTSMAAFLGLSR